MSRKRCEKSVLLMSPSCSESTRRGLRVAGLVLALGLLACSPLSIPEEQQLGRQMSRELRGQLVFVRDPIVVDYIEDLGREILDAAGRQPFEYHFYVVEDNELNAFAAPAGHVYVNTGTILAARNASELAGVIAHEIGHVAYRHVANNYNRQRNTGIAYQAGVVAAALLGGGLGASAAQLGGGLAATVYLNQFGREAEMQADAFAVAAMPRANWDPNGLVSFFQTLQAQGGPNVPTFLSSHPATQERIDAAKTRIAELSPGGSLRTDDGGKLAIIQRRIEILTGSSRPQPKPQY
jgi:predicted Zn-dependent protease